MVRGRDVSIYEFVKKQIYHIFPSLEAKYWYDDVIDQLNEYKNPDFETAQMVINEVLRRAKGKD